MGSLQIFTIIMSIKSKLIYISMVLWINKKSVHKVHSQGCSRTCSGTYTIQSVFLVGSQVWEQLTSKKINRHIRVRHLEVQRYWPSSLYHFKVPKIQAFSHVALPYMSCFVTIISISKESGLVIAIITNSSQPEGRSGKQERLHLVREHLRNSTSILHSIIQNVNTAALL